MDDALRESTSVATCGAPDKLFCHRSCVPLREADLGAEGNDDQLEFEFARECEGMCGV